MPAIDFERTEELNKAFRTRQQEEAAAAELAAAESGLGPISASSLGDSWKSAYTSGGNASSYALDAQINRVRKAANEQALLEQMMKDEADNQAAKRASDLDKWRKMYNKALTGGSSAGTSLFGNL